MSVPRTPLLLLVFATCLATTAWFFTFGAEAAVNLGDTMLVHPAPVAPAGAAPVIVARGQPATAVDPAAAGPTRIPGARVQISFVTLARPLPVREWAPRCELVVGDAARGEPGRWVAGTAATPLTRQPRGHQLARFELNGTAHYRVVRLFGREAGVVPVRMGMTSSVRGRVVDADGAALSGARVWLAGQEARSDADGYFEVAPLPIGDGMPLVVQAKGAATYYRVLDSRQCLTLGRTPIAMNRPGCRLRARFFAAGGEVTAARFYLLPAGRRHASLLSYPFFMAEIEPVQVQADGTATFEGLPMGVRVQVLVQQADGPPVVSQELALDSVEQACVLHGTVQGQLTGKVVDAEGRALAGAFLSSRAGGTGLALHGSSWLLPGAAYLRDGVLASTAEDGSFRLAMVWGRAGADQLGVGLVAVEAPGMVGLEYRIDQAPDGDLPQRFMLFEASAGGRPQLELEAADLPEFVEVVVLTDGGPQGPYPWPTDEAFALPLRGAALMRVTTQVDQAEVHQATVFVDGAVPLVVRR